MLPYSDNRLTRIALVAFFLLILGYAYFEARGILYGPRINVPTGQTEVHERFIHIQGTADHIAAISMNGKEIAVTEAGAFDEPYLLALGYNRIILEARDKYGNKTSREIGITYVPDPASPTTKIATTSPATSTGAVAP
ncbi:hypothetical protein HY968_02690 [Candidatus Kaiserbacteria bacterium]|nr:hypothetical protein [Candidatus Kaiserbacteria bacterium]